MRTFSTLDRHSNYPLFFLIREVSNHILPCVFTGGKAPKREKGVVTAFYRATNLRCLGLRADIPQGWDNIYRGIEFKGHREPWKKKHPRIRGTVGKNESGFLFSLAFLW